MFAKALTRIAAAAVLLASCAAFAQSAPQLSTTFARQVYAGNASQVHDERPQPLLRAVVVLRVRLDEQGQWAAEVFRDNPTQPEMTRAALESLTRTAVPSGLSAAELQQLRTEGLIEAWLFQTNGKFALKTLAKPQRGA